MTLHEYQVEQMRTAPLQNYESKKDMLLNALLGIFGQGGETADIVKKHIFQSKDHPLDREHMREEMGDILWYLSLAASALDLDLEDVARANVNKLRKRYPQGFDPERSVNRE